MSYFLCYLIGFSEMENCFCSEKRYRTSKIGNESWNRLLLARTRFLVYFWVVFFTYCGHDIYPLSEIQFNIFSF